MKLTIANFDPRGALTRFVVRNPEPAPVPVPTEGDLERFRELIDEAVTTGLAAGFEHREPVQSELAMLNSDFAGYLARTFARQLAAHF